MSPSIPGFRRRQYPDHDVEEASQLSEELTPRMDHPTGDPTTHHLAPDPDHSTTASEYRLYGSASPDSGEFLLITVLQRLFHCLSKDRDLRSFFQAHFTRQEERESVFNTDVSAKLDKMNNSQEKMNDSLSAKLDKMNDSLSTKLDKMNDSISAKLDKMNDSQNKMNDSQEKVLHLLAAILETLKKWVLFDLLYWHALRLSYRSNTPLHSV
jgi:hypothetical protein